jgi:hypothetical protein
MFPCADVMNSDLAEKNNQTRLRHEKKIISLGAALIDQGREVASNKQAADDNNSAAVAAHTELLQLQGKISKSSPDVRPFVLTINIEKLGQAMVGHEESIHTLESSLAKREQEVENLKAQLKDREARVSKAEAELRSVRGAPVAWHINDEHKTDAFFPDSNRSISLLSVREDSESDRGKPSGVLQSILERIRLLWCNVTDYKKIRQ